MSNLHVMLGPDGRWGVREAEDGEILSQHDGREEAETAAKQLAKERDGAEVRVHEAEGEISEREQVE